jgi:nitrite reductase (NADH) large subunit
MSKLMGKYACDCKSVKGSDVRRSIRESGAETLVDIQNLTKASTGCGRCKPQVVAILESELKRINLAGRQLKLDL